MKVIEAPNIDGWKYQCDCYTCHAKLEAGADDLQYKVVRNYHSGSDYDDAGYYSSDDTYYVICPLCSKEVSVRMGDVPYLLKEKTKKK